MFKLFWHSFLWVYPDFGEDRRSSALYYLLTPITFWLFLSSALTFWAELAANDRRLKASWLKATHFDLKSGRTVEAFREIVWLVIVRETILNATNYPSAVHNSVFVIPFSPSCNIRLVITWIRMRVNENRDLLFLQGYFQEFSNVSTKVYLRAKRYYTFYLICRSYVYLSAAGLCKYLVCWIDGLVWSWKWIKINVTKCNLLPRECHY